MIRDYTQAATDLQKLISILEHQSDDKIKQSGSQGRSTRGKEIRQAHKRLSLMEEEAKKGVSLDFYQILYVLYAFEPSEPSFYWYCLVRHAACQRHNHNDKKASKALLESRTWCWKVLFFMYF